MRRDSATLLLAFAVIMASSGCAFVTRTAELRWPAREGEPLAATPPAMAPAVSLLPVDDKRAEPRAVVGAVRNGWGMHTADVVTQDNVALWASAAFKDEIQRVGIRVVETAPGVPAVGAMITRLEGDAFFVYSGAAEFRVWMRDGEKVAFDQIIRGAGSAGMNFAATGEGYALTLAAALKDAASKAARVVAGALGVAVPRPPPVPAAEPGS